MKILDHTDDLTHAVIISEFLPCGIFHTHNPDSGFIDNKGALFVSGKFIAEVPAGYKFDVLQVQKTIVHPQVMEQNPSIALFSLPSGNASRPDVRGQEGRSGGCGDLGMAGELCFESLGMLLEISVVLIYPCGDDLLLVKSPILGADELHLTEDHNRGDDQGNGDHELGHDKRVPEDRSLMSACMHFSPQCCDRLE